MDTDTLFRKGIHQIKRIAEILTLLVATCPISCAMNAEIC